MKYKIEKECFGYVKNVLYFPRLRDGVRDRGQQLW